MELEVIDKFCLEAVMIKMLLKKFSYLSSQAIILWKVLCVVKDGTYNSMIEKKINEKKRRERNSHLGD